jgi:hypothetical protein
MLDLFLLLLKPSLLKTKELVNFLELALEVGYLGFSSIECLLLIIQLDLKPRQLSNQL